MNIRDVAIQPPSISTPAPDGAWSKTEPAPGSSLTLPTIPSSTVSISGQALVRQRIFDCNDPSIKLPLATGYNGYKNMRPMTHFLTEQDRQVLAEIYEFAQEQGADLGYVTSLGFGLAHYRERDSGQYAGSLNDGSHFDLEGHMASFAFTEKDTATAKRILTSEEIKTTRLDHGFLRFELNKDYSAIGHSDFEFLEQVVNKLSARGEGVLASNSKFSNDRNAERTFIKTHSKEVYEHLGNGRSRIKRSTGGKLKGSKQQPSPTRPETLRQTFRRLMLQALGSNVGLRITSLAEFLLKSRR